MIRDDPKKQPAAGLSRCGPFSLFAFRLKTEATEKRALPTDYRTVIVTVSVGAISFGMTKV